VTDEWGPWIRHDGAAPQVAPPRTLLVEFEGEGLRAPSGKITPSYPGFYWRWRTVKTGWFRREKRRVCDDPAYAPIIAYRLRRPPALRQLIDLAENPPALAPAGADGTAPARVRPGPVVAR